MAPPADVEGVTTAAAGTPSIVRDVQAVRSRVSIACERAGRDATSVTLIAVSKTQPPEAIIAAWQAGIRDFGENYVQEALAKLGPVRAAAGDGPLFHFIGHLQRNKAKSAAGAFAILHSVDSERLLDAIHAAAPPAPIPVMFEVNVAAEPSKSGVVPGELAALVAHARSLGSVRALGLMTVPPVAGTPDASRLIFRQLRELGETLGLPALSMGMSGDFEVAIEEGATYVRVGRAIFGERLS